MDMHDQSAGRISGRTRASVSAMCVCALRITVLKSAGNFTRDECHNLNAEKIQRVKCFIFTRCGICCVLAIFERRRGRLSSKISGCGQLAEVAVYFAMSGLPRNQTAIGRVGMAALCPGADINSTCLTLWKASSKAIRQARLRNIRFAPLPLGREQSDAFCEALQGMTTFVMKPDV